MISIGTETRVAKLLIAVAECEKAVEISRQVLGNNIDFNPYQAFRRLDRESKNYVDSYNIVDFLK